MAGTVAVLSNCTPRRLYIRRPAQPPALVASSTADLRNVTQPSEFCAAPSRPPGTRRQDKGRSQSPLPKNPHAIEVALPKSPVCDRHHRIPDRLRVRLALCRPMTASSRVGVNEPGKSAPSGTECMIGWPGMRCCGSQTNTTASPIGAKSRHGTFRPFRS
jgi:hypothetical protein